MYFAGPIPRTWRPKNNPSDILNPMGVQISGLLSFGALECNLQIYNLKKVMVNHFGPIRRTGCPLDNPIGILGPRWDPIPST